LLPGARYKADLSYQYDKISFYSNNSDDLDDEVGRIEHIVDSSLLDERNGFLLFSGGVDSGLIAARAKVLGRNDIVLLN